MLELKLQQISSILSVHLKPSHTQYISPPASPAPPTPSACPVSHVQAYVLYY